MVLPFLLHWAPLGEEDECQSRHRPSLPGVSQLGRFSAGLAGAGMCRCTREKRSSAWEQSKVNAFGATRVCPAPPLAQALALELNHYRVRLLTRQTPFLGLQRSQGQHTPAQLPRRLFCKRRQLVEEVFVAGDQSPWQPPRFPVFSCCTARVCSWVCVPGRGRRRRGGGAQGLRGEEGSAIPVRGSTLLPLPRKHGNGGQASWPPLGRAGGRQGCLGKGLPVNRVSNLPQAQGSSFSLSGSGGVVSRSCSIPASGSMAGSSLSRFGKCQPHPR